MSGVHGTERLTVFGLGGGGVCIPLAFVMEEEQTGWYLSGQVHPKGSISRHGIKDSFGGIRHLRDDPQDYSQLPRDAEQARGGAEKEAAKIMDSEQNDEKTIPIPLRADLSMPPICFSGEIAEMQRLQDNAAEERTKERNVFRREEDDDGVNGGRMRPLASFDVNSSSSRMPHRAAAGAAAAVQNPKLRIKLCSKESKRLSSTMGGAAPNKAMTFSSQNKENIGLVPLCPGTTQIRGTKRKTNHPSGVSHGAKKRNCEGMGAAVPLNPRIDHHSRKRLPLPPSAGTTGAIIGRRSPSKGGAEMYGGGPPPKSSEQSRMDLLLMAVTAADEPQRAMQKANESHAIMSSPLVSKFVQQQAPSDAIRPPPYPDTRSSTAEAPVSNALLDYMGVAPPAAAARYQPAVQTSEVQQEGHARVVDARTAGGTLCRDKDELTMIERQQHRPSIPVPPPAYTLGVGSEARGSKAIHTDNNQTHLKDGAVSGGSVELPHCIMKPNLCPTTFGDPAGNVKGVEEACTLQGGVDEDVDDESTDSDEHLKLNIPIMKVHQYRTAKGLVSDCLKQPLRLGQVRNCDSYTDSDMAAAAKIPRKLPAAFKGKMVKFKGESEYKQEKSCSDDDFHLNNYSMDPYQQRPAPSRTITATNSAQGSLQQPLRQSEKGYKDDASDKYCLKPHGYRPAPAPAPPSSGIVVAKSSEGLHQTLRQEKRKCGDDDSNNYSMDPHGDKPAVAIFAKSNKGLERSSTRHQSDEELNTFCMESHEYRPAPSKRMPEKGRPGFEQQPASQAESRGRDEEDEIGYDSFEEANYLKARGYVGRIGGVYVKTYAEARRLLLQQQGKRPAQCSARDESSSLSDTDDGCYLRPHRFQMPLNRETESRRLLLQQQEERLARCSAKDESSSLSDTDDRCHLRPHRFAGKSLNREVQGETRTQTSRPWRKRSDKGSWSGEDGIIYSDVDERYYTKLQRHEGAQPRGTVKSQHIGKFETQGIVHQEQQQVNEAPAPASKSKSSEHGSDSRTWRSSQQHEKFKGGRRVQFCEPMPRASAHPPGGGRHHPLHHRIPKASLPSSSSVGARTSGSDQQQPSRTNTNDVRKRKKANSSGQGSAFCIVPKQVASVTTTAATSCLVVVESGEAGDLSLSSIGDVVVECLPPSSSSSIRAAAQEPVREGGLPGMSSSQAMIEDSNYILSSQGSSHGKQPRCGEKNGDVVRPQPLAGRLQSGEGGEDIAFAAAAAPPPQKGGPTTTISAASSLSAGGERRAGEGRVSFTIGGAANRFAKQCGGMQADMRIVSSCKPSLPRAKGTRALAEGVTVIPGNNGPLSSGPSSRPSVSITYLGHTTMNSSRLQVDPAAAAASGSERIRSSSPCSSTLVCSAGQHQQDPSCCSSDHHEIAGISLPWRSWEALKAAEALGKNKFIPKQKLGIPVPLSLPSSRFQDANNNDKKDLQREIRWGSETGAGIGSHSYSNPPEVQKAASGQMRGLKQSQRQERLSFKVLNGTVEKNLSKLKDINKRLSSPGVGVEGEGDIHRLSQGQTPTVHGGQLLGKKSSSCILNGNGIDRSAAVPKCSSTSNLSSSKPQQSTAPLAPKPIIRRRRGWKRLEKERLKAAKHKSGSSCKFKLLAEPSGLLGNLNPGILQKVRNSAQIRTFLGALIGGAAAFCQKTTQTQGIVVARGNMPPPLRAPESPGKEKEAGGVAVTTEGAPEVFPVSAFAGGESERLENSIDPAGLALGESAVAAVAPPPTLQQEDLQVLSLQGPEGGRYLEQPEQSSESNELPAAAQQLSVAELPDQHRPKTHLPACSIECQVLTAAAPANDSYQRQPGCLPQEAPKTSSSCPPSAEEAVEPEMLSVSETGSSPAELAGLWMELLIYDIEGRLSALQRSRRRVQSTLEALPRSVESSMIALPCVLNDNVPPPRGSSSSDINVDTTVGSQQRRVCSDATNVPLPAPGSGGGLVEDEAAAAVAADSIRALVANMDNVLGKESAKLMTSLEQVQQMRALCPGFFNHQKAAQLSAPEKMRLVRAAAVAVGSENQPPPERWPLTMELGVAASAASMFSTANFVTKARSFR